MLPAVVSGQLPWHQRTFGKSVGPGSKGHNRAVLLPPALCHLALAISRCSAGPGHQKQDVRKDKSGWEAKCH